MLVVDSHSTTASLEHQAELLGTQDAEQVQIPTNLWNHTLGLEASLIQTLITWSQTKDGAALVTHLPRGVSVQNQIQNLCNTTHGLVAVLCARRILRATGEDISQEAKHIAATRYRALSRVHLQPGKLIAFVCDGHPYTDINASFNSLTTGDRSRRKETFLTDIRYHLGRCFSSYNAVPLKDADTSAILEIVYELFANAEEWGTSDITFAPLKNSFRGFLAEVVPITNIRGLLNAPTDGLNASLARYFTQLLAPSQSKVTHLLELSVFDSGVGLGARKAQSRPDLKLSAEEEYENIMACLRLHGSSSSDAMRGMGLFQVLGLLTRLKGFWKLRCGHLGLFRDFIEDPFAFTEPQREGHQRAFRQGFEYLWDWDSDPQTVRLSPTADIGRRKRPHLAGTLFTLWIPLREHAEQLSLLKEL